MKTLDLYIQKWRFKVAGSFVQNKSKLLDIGCNNCEIFTYLKDKEIYGVGIDPNTDLSQKDLPVNIKFIRSSFPSDEKLDNNFDYITALAVLEHIPTEEQSKFSRACFDHLKKSGRIIITVPSPIVDTIIIILKFIRVLDGMEDHQHYGFKIKQTIPIFENSGFKLIKFKRFQFGLNNLFVFEKI